jgi:hypothetical protein
LLFGLQVCIYYKNISSQQGISEGLTEGIPESDISVGYKTTYIKDSETSIDLLVRVITNIENELTTSLELFQGTAYFGIWLKIPKKSTKYRVVRAQIRGLSNASRLFRLEMTA